MRTVLMICLAGMLVASAQEKPKGATRPAGSVMTGCIDQRGEQYVLTGDKELNAVAILHGDGFSDDNFARYMGHKVSVEGTSSREGETVTVRVRKITDIADSCSPE
jgi:hypothetical protein